MHVTHIYSINSEDQTIINASSSSKKTTFACSGYFHHSANESEYDWMSNDCSCPYIPLLLSKEATQYLLSKDVIDPEDDQTANVLAESAISIWNSTNAWHRNNPSSIIERLKGIYGTTILSIGDSQDRNTVKIMCDDLHGTLDFPLSKEQLAVRNGWSPSTCYVPWLQLTLVNIFTYGALQDTYPNPRKPELPTLDILFNKWLPDTLASVGKNTSDVKYITVNQCLWDIQNENPSWLKHLERNEGEAYAGLWKNLIKTSILNPLRSIMPNTRMGWRTCSTQFFGSQFKHKIDIMNVHARALATREKMDILDFERIMDGNGKGSRRATSYDEVHFAAQFQRNYINLLLNALSCPNATRIRMQSPTILAVPEFTNQLASRQGFRRYLTSFREDNSVGEAWLNYKDVAIGSWLEHTELLHQQAGLNVWPYPNSVILPELIVIIGVRSSTGVSGQRIRQINQRMSKEPFNEWYWQFGWPTTALLGSKRATTLMQRYMSKQWHPKATRGSYGTYPMSLSLKGITTLYDAVFGSTEHVDYEKFEPGQSDYRGVQTLPKLQQDGSAIMILEDDSVFVPYFKQKLSLSLNQLPAHLPWIAWVGGCLDNDEDTVSPNDINIKPLMLRDLPGMNFNPSLYLRPKYDARCGNGYMLNRLGAHAVLKEMESWAKEKNADPDLNIDWYYRHILARMKEKKSILSYWIEPVLSYQSNKARIVMDGDSAVDDFHATQFTYVSSIQVNCVYADTDKGMIRVSHDYQQSHPDCKNNEFNEDKMTAK